MKNKIIILLATALLTSGLIVGLTAHAQPAPAPEHHPAIRHAIVALEQTKVYLKSANHDFGGHRADALAEVDKALVQLKLALQYDKN
jgi:hypothetical protein